MDLVLSGDPVESIEAAKRIVEQENVDPSSLARIAADRNANKWSRIAAIYALGFIDDESKSAPALLRILADRDDDESCRSHAAEALGHMAEPKTIPAMERLLLADDSQEVKRWCVYALGELGGQEALKTLQKFAMTNPSGLLADELRAVLER
jgi:HEAT repeat protein